MSVQLESPKLESGNYSTTSTDFNEKKAKSCAPLLGAASIIGFVASAAGFVAGSVGASRINPCTDVTVLIPLLPDLIGVGLGGISLLASVAIRVNAGHSTLSTTRKVQLGCVFAANILSCAMGGIGLALTAKNVSDCT